MKTPEEIADETATEFDNLPASGDELVQLIAKAIEADRAQRVGFYVPTKVHEPGAMFLREVWINGEAPDGTKLDMTRTWGGAGMVLEITKPDGTSIVESLNASELTQAWATAAEARA